MSISCCNGLYLDPYRLYLLGIEGNIAPAVLVGKIRQDFRYSNYDDGWKSTTTQNEYGTVQLR